jgi:hypothetical protein
MCVYTPALFSHPSLEQNASHGHGRKRERKGRTRWTIFLHRIEHTNVARDVTQIFLKRNGFLSNLVRMITKKRKSSD